MKRTLHTHTNLISDFALINSKKDKYFGNHSVNTDIYLGYLQENALPNNISSFKAWKAQRGK